VVFSRKAVHAVAAEVAAAGLRASVIYGALPHDVRHEEARRFDEGETDVVVATDAIGMGMNLPIRRIVFVEQQKYDGHDMRTLRPDEVQQIAGRAGRFGRYEEGLFTALERRRQIVRLYGADVPAIESIPVGVPEDIALVRDATLGESIRQWAALDQPEPFYRIDVQRDLRLIAEVEGMLAEDQRQDRDVKLKVLSLATMPFDEDDRTLHRTWRMMAEAELAGRMAMLPMPAEPGEDAPLATLEEEYRYCDLLYTYARTFGHEGWLAPLTDLRTRISHVIMTILAEA
jgi:ATP-dependent RNA helicase SUPV3L1/SUV3